jgi:hypothetical protein
MPATELSGIRSPGGRDGGSSGGRGVLAGLSPAPAEWRDVKAEGGTNGIVARRQVTVHPQGHVYNLWLVERLAEGLGA